MLLSGRNIKSALGLTCIALLCALTLTSVAGARTVEPYVYESSFNGAGTNPGGVFRSSIDLLAIHQADGRVYVHDRDRLSGTIGQYDSSGVPVPFSALSGASALHSLGFPYEQYGMAVDNSNAATNGRIYLATNAKHLLQAYEPDGTEVGAPFPLGGLNGITGVAVDAEGDIWISELATDQVIEYDSAGQLTGNHFPVPDPGTLAIDSQGNFYVGSASEVINTNGGVQNFGGGVRKYDASGQFEYTLLGGIGILGTAVAVDPSNDHVFALYQGFPDYDISIREFDPAGNPLSRIGDPDPGHSFPGVGQGWGLGVNGTTHKLYVFNPNSSGGVGVDVFARSAPIIVPSIANLPPEPHPTEVTLRGTVDTDGGGDTTDCHFYWIGSGLPYPRGPLPCNPSPVTGSGPHEVTAQLTGLVKGEGYTVYLTAKNANGVAAVARNYIVHPQGPPSIANEAVGDINTDGAKLEGDIDPNGGVTTYHFEYGPQDCASNPCVSVSAENLPLTKVLGVQHVSAVLTGLQPDTIYHYRLVIDTPVGEKLGPDERFTTFAIDSSQDQCGNALVRKQTKTGALPDCRAYELVSASGTDGYDVRSDVVTGQSPFIAAPRAHDSVLYTLSFGAIPGVSGEPTNYDFDPYVARRSSTGWTTQYEGISVGDPPAQGTFSSEPSEESGDLSALAFGGSHLCAPCFADGKTGIPVRRAHGKVVQGMAGSLDPGASAATDGYVGRQLSADGTHLVFGSAAKFEPDGNTNGDVSIYDRNLVTEKTHVVSKAPNGANLTCLQGVGTCHSPGDGDGIASLGMSDDGSRIVVAQKVSTDAAGNEYWHPYMNIGDAAQTVDLAPGAGSGVLFDGITADGSEVLYTTTAKMDGGDTDDSPDIYRAAVGSNGTVTITRVSTGISGTGDTNSCTPAANLDGNNWSAPGPASPDLCGAVAFAGGAGLASEAGTLYFLSPELLDGPSHGAADQPNLYVAAPGQAPHYVATLEVDNDAVRNAVGDSASHSYGDIQVTPSGADAAFSSNQALTGYPTFGHFAIYRYSAAHGLECGSCAITRATLKTDTRLDPFGLNLADDGRLLFTSAEPLALSDSGSTRDVYEWDGGPSWLISTGRSATDAGLLGVSADGVNAYFFTRDRLVDEDHNGEAVRIYDAREGGGFEAIPSRVPCQASDECHGPGSVATTRPDAATTHGVGGNVKKKHRRKHNHKRHQHRHTGKRGSRR